VGRDTFDVFQWLTRRVRGGLGLATVGANAVFAAITGISIASASVFTKVAVPEMIRHGYTRRFAVGVVAGSSVLGMLIPPSLLMIIYGVLAEESVGRMFMAGVIPGIVLALGFALLIVGMAYLRPGMILVQGSADAARDDEPQETLRTAAIKFIPILGLIVLVLGIFLAHFTRFGRNVYAIGGNDTGALLLGVPIARTIISVYALSSFLATFAGIVLSLSKRSGDSTIAVGAELDVIAAVVIGGTLLTGGVGYVIGTFIGVMLPGVIRTYLTLDGSLTPWWTKIIIGILLFAFIALQKLLSNRSSLLGWIRVLQRTGRSDAPESV
jgi:ribose/xylose/arabinose/galactoside ABC-type transport system permease subunit